MGSPKALHEMEINLYILATEMEPPSYVEPYLDQTQGAMVSYGQSGYNDGYNTGYNTGPMLLLSPMTMVCTQ